MNLLDFYGDSYYEVSKQVFEDWQMQSAGTFGLILCCILMPIYFNFYNMAKKKFEKMYPEEKVIYVVKNGVFFMFFVTFCLGGYFGGFIVPFFVFQDVPQNITGCFNLFIALILYPIGLYAIIFRFAIIYVLSNKRIKQFIFMRSPKFNLTSPSFEYKNIDTLIYDKFMTWESLYLKMKNGKVFKGLIFFKHLKYVKNLIEENMKKEAMNG